MIARLIIALAILALTFGAGPASVGAAQDTAQPQTSLAEVEDEVMCPVCGTLLGLSQAPQADRERALIERLIDEGLTKEEIKDELVAEYGPQVLALPESSGFNLTAYLVPIVGLLVAAVLLFVAVWRWRRETAETDAAEAAGPSGEKADPGAGSPVGEGANPDGEGSTDRGEASSVSARGDGLSDDESERLDRDLNRYDL